MPRRAPCLHAQITPLFEACRIASCAIESCDAEPESMSTLMHRRTLLVIGATAAAGAASSRRLPVAAQATATDLYPSNTALYLDPALVEGVDYGRRYRRHQVFDDSLAQGTELVRSVIIAPHGGGIEPGTSELCLAIAGYDPATLVARFGDAALRDYWMFEGLRGSGNAALHVTSSHCDDGVALALCAGAWNALALHGCATATVGLPDDSRTVLVGGRQNELKQRLLSAFDDACIEALDASNVEAIDGDSPANIANRTLLGMGGHLELTGPLRQAMFEVNTRTDRKNTTTELFWRFVAACRTALTEVEASQPIL